MTTQSIVWWIVGLFVVAIGTWALFGMQKESAMEKEMMKGEAVMEEKEGMMKKEGDAMMGKEGETMMDDNNPPASGGGDTMMKKGSYEAYSAEKIARAQSGDVVLYFRASWCPVCKALDANIKGNLASIPEGLTILDVDYDSSQSLKQKYGVTYQHTFVQVDAEGNLIKKWSGSPTLTALVAEVQ